MNREKRGGDPWAIRQPSQDSPALHSRRAVARTWRVGCASPRDSERSARGRASDRGRPGKKGASPCPARRKSFRLSLYPPDAERVQERGRGRRRVVRLQVRERLRRGVEFGLRLSERSVVPRVARVRATAVRVGEKARVRARGGRPWGGGLRPPPPPPPP